MKVERNGVLVLGIQLGILSCVAGVSSYEFSQSPRVWVKVKNLYSNGERYLNLQVCPETWPAGNLQNLPVRLRVGNGHLLSEQGTPENRVRLSQEGGRACLSPLVGYLLPEGAKPGSYGKEFWAELQVPNEELPRVLQIALDKPQ